MKTEISSFHHRILVHDLSQKALNQYLLNTKLMNTKLINAKECEAMKPSPSHCCWLIEPASLAITDNGTN